MEFSTDKFTFYGPLEYLPASTQEFITIVPELYKIDLQVYFTLAANIDDFTNFRTTPITPKEISEKLNKSHSSICNSLRRLKSTKLPSSGKPLIIQEHDTYIFPDFQRASIIQNLVG